jgi:hypothetical protein
MDVEEEKGGEEQPSGMVQRFINFLQRENSTL